jgi:DNA processing protein
MEIQEFKISDAGYPEILREIPDPPEVLYVRGTLDYFGRPAIAVVGSRKPTVYGTQVAKMLVGQVARQSIIISGLAYGIDALAHESALAVGGITWAVLGTGIDDASIYPAIHRGLAHRILAAGGAIISEYPPGTPALQHHFPLRNRIIAGLSQKVVVVEAKVKSGALITGRLGLDYNREVLAVPGPITSPESEGTNRLIVEGAQPVLTAGDIIEVGELVASGKIENDLTDREQIVYKSLMSGSPKSVDELVGATGLTSREVNEILTLLEMRGIVMAKMGAFVVNK